MAFAGVHNYFRRVQKTTLQIGSVGGQVSEAQVGQLVAQALPPADYQGKRVLLIVPDHTRTAPVGLLFKTILHDLALITR